MGQLLARSGLSKEQQQEIEEATHSRFSIAEIKQEYKEFKKRYGSDYMNKDQFLERYKDIFHNREISDRVFHLFDTNNNGELDFKEFMCAISITTRGDPDEKLRVLFEMYDEDEDMYITREELLGITRIMYGIQGKIGTMSRFQEDENTPEKRVDKIFRYMDKNDDSKLSYEEFVEGCKQHPEIMQVV